MTETNFNNGKIYSIKSYKTDKIYIGSTTLKLSRRLSFHKSDYKGWKNNKRPYITSFEILKFDDYYIELFENYACNNKLELLQREGQVIKQHDNIINKNVAGRTITEYKNDNREKLKAEHKKYDGLYKDKRKEYNNKNKERIKIRRRKYYIDSKMKLVNNDMINLKECIINTINKRKLEYKRQLDEINKMSLTFGLDIIN